MDTISKFTHGNYRSSKIYRQWSGSALNSAVTNKSLNLFLPTLVVAKSKRQLEELLISFPENVRPSIALIKELKKVWDIMKENNEEHIILSWLFDANLMGSSKILLNYYWHIIAQGRQLEQHLNSNHVIVKYDQDYYFFNADLTLAGGRVPIKIMVYLERQLKEFGIRLCLKSFNEKIAQDITTSLPPDFKAWAGEKENALIYFFDKVESLTKLLDSTKCERIVVQGKVDEFKGVIKNSLSGIEVEINFTSPPIHWLLE